MRNLRDECKGLCMGSLGLLLVVLPLVVVRKVSDVLSATAQMNSTIKMARNHETHSTGYLMVES